VSGEEGRSGVVGTPSEEGEQGEELDREELDWEEAKEHTGISFEFVALNLLSMVTLRLNLDVLMGPQWFLTFRRE